MKKTKAPTSREPRYSLWQLDAQLEQALTRTGARTVYMLEAKRTKLVKIGVTSDLPARMAQIARQTGSPIKCLLRFAGDKAMESGLHGVFDEYRVVGEWFRREGRLAAFIDAQRGQP